MMKKSLIETLVKFVLGAIIILLVDQLFDSVYVDGFEIALLVAVVLSILNKIVKPILTILALPMTIMTLGLFQLVVNGFILKLATMLLSPRFYIDSFFMTIITSICISIMYSIVGLNDES